MRMTSSSTLGSILLAAALVPACADEPSIEDGADDAFTSADDKADAFGVEDWSPDGAAVLTYVNRATKGDLMDEAGLSARVAGNIVKGRAGADGRVGTRDDKPYKDLADLDAQPYVGKAVYGALAGYALEAGLYKTSLRMPLAIRTGTDRNGRDVVKPLASFNSQLVAAGLRPFGRYVYFNEDTDVGAKMGPYDARVTEMIAKLHLELDGDSTYFGLGFNDFGAGTAAPCYVGDVEHVRDAMDPAISVIITEQYSIYAWRYGTKKFFADDMDETADNEGEYDLAWDRFDTRSKSIAFEYSVGDDGTDRSTDVIASCR